MSNFVHYNTILWSVIFLKVINRPNYQGHAQSFRAIFTRSYDTLSMRMENMTHHIPDEILVVIFTFLPTTYNNWLNIFKTSKRFYLVGKKQAIHRARSILELYGEKQVRSYYY